MFYVADDGSDTNTGLTEDSPWPLDMAANGPFPNRVVADGATFLLIAGTLTAPSGGLTQTLDGTP